MTAVFIDPRTQYLTVDGKQAAVRDKFTYFESGTNNPKAIFNDIGKTTPLNNEQLTNSRGELPEIYFDGVARVVRVDENGVQRWDLDPVTGSGSASTFQQWSPEVTYSLNDIVQGSDGELYQSTSDNNQNKDPTDSANRPTFWKTVIQPFTRADFHANALSF